MKAKWNWICLWNMLSCQWNFFSIYFHVKKTFCGCQNLSIHTILLEIKPSECIRLLYLARLNFYIYQTWKMVKPKTLIGQYGKDRLFFSRGMYTKVVLIFYTVVCQLIHSCKVQIVFSQEASNANWWVNWFKLKACLL